MELPHRRRQSSRPIASIPRQSGTRYGAPSRRALTVTFAGETPPGRPQTPGVTRVIGRDNALGQSVKNSRECVQRLACGNGLTTALARAADRLVARQRDLDLSIREQVRARRDEQNSPRRSDDYPCSASWLLGRPRPITPNCPTPHNEKRTRLQIATTSGAMGPCKRSTRWAHRSRTAR